MPLAPRHAEVDSVRHDPTASSRQPHRPRLTVRHPGASSEGIPRDFREFAACLRGELAPATLIEQILAERVILATWRLHQVSRIEFQAASRHPSGESLPPIGRAVLRAESSLETALVLLHSARGTTRKRWGTAAPVPSKSASLNVDCVASAEPETETDDIASHEQSAVFSNEWTPLPDQDGDSSASSAAPLTDRLAFDPDVSDSSPVVRGTWVTVRHVVSLIVDGWTWSDILRTHPELTEDDIRACLRYTIEHDDNTAI